MLLEADMVQELVGMKEVDLTNVWKICQYLLRIVHFHYEKEQRDRIYEVRTSGRFPPRLPTDCSPASTCGSTGCSVPL